MRINSIQSNDNYASKNSFGSVIYESGVEIPSKLAYIFKKAEKELANTKYWDLVVSKKNSENFAYYYQNKSNPLEVLSGKAETL